MALLHQLHDQLGLEEVGGIANGRELRLLDGDDVHEAVAVRRILTLLARDLHDPLALGIDRDLGELERGLRSLNDRQCKTVMPYR